jgi:hypothetical protein
MKRSLGGMSPASGYHARVNPLNSQAGEKVPTTHGYPLKPLDIMLGSSKKSWFLVLSSLNNETNFEHSLFSSFKLTKK